MSKWPRTPRDMLLRTERYVDGEWQQVKFTDLEMGDYFRQFYPDHDEECGGKRVLYAGEGEDVGLAQGFPSEHLEIGYGYGVVTEFMTEAEMMKRIRN